MATKLGDITVGADGTWSSGPHTLASGARTVTLRRKSDGAVLATRNFTVQAAAGVTYVGVGTLATSPSIHASVADNDILLLTVCDGNAATPSGWTLIGATVFSMARVFWRRKAAGYTAPACSTYAFITAWRGCLASGSPINAYSTSFDSPSTPPEYVNHANGVTTTVANCRILAVYGVTAGSVTAAPTITGSGLSFTNHGTWIFDDEENLQQIGGWTESAAQGSAGATGNLLGAYGGMIVALTPA